MIMIVSGALLKILKFLSFQQAYITIYRILHQFPVP